MAYIHFKIGNRIFSIHQAWIGILVYGTSYYLIHLFLLKFLLNYSIEHDNNDQLNNDQDNNKNNTDKDSKIKNNSKNKIEILRGRKRKLIASAMLTLRLLFSGLQSASSSSNSNTFQSGGNSKTEISRTLGQESSMIADFNQDDSTQSELVQRIIVTPFGKIMGMIPRGGDINEPGKPSKFGPGSKARGAAKRDFALRQAVKKPTNRQSGGDLFADAFTVKPQYPARPGGLKPFGRVPPKLWTDAHNPGRADGLQSKITLESKQSQSEYQPDGYSEEQIQIYEKNTRYSELAKDPQLMDQERPTNSKSKEEACTILQSENEGLVSGARRPDLKAGDPNYDYKTETPSKFSEIKVPRDDSLKDTARLGRKSGLQQGNNGDVTIVVNLMRLRPEKRAAYAKTFLEAAGGKGVIFINN